MSDHRSTPLPSGGSVFSGAALDKVFIRLKMGDGEFMMHMSAADAAAMGSALLLHARPAPPAMQEAA